MLAKLLPDLSEQDFASLVANNVSERRDLEFKRDLPGNSDGDIREFLADVTSLANAQGGDLIFGIEDKGGAAIAMPGVNPSDVDATLLRLENIVRDGVVPRLTARLQWVRLASGNGVLVMRIPASLAAPHRIRFKNSGRFWSRNSRGKYEMDVHELRQAFTESEAIPQRMRGLHESAIAAAMGTNMPFSMGSDPTAVISIIPLGFLRERRDLELTSDNALVPVRVTPGFHSLPTLEGILWHTSADEHGIVKSYALTHRTGRIDAAWTIGGIGDVRGRASANIVWHEEFDKGIGEMVLHGTGRLQSYGIDGPWIIMTSIIKLNGATLLLQNGSCSRSAWRQSANLPELILDRITEESLTPVLRSLWLLFGLTKPR